MGFYFKNIIGEFRIFDRLLDYGRYVGTDGWRKAQRQRSVLVDISGGG